MLIEKLLGEGNNKDGEKKKCIKLSIINKK